MTKTVTLPANRLEIYQGDDRKYRWRLISKAETRAHSTQSYVSKQGCLIALKRAKSLMQDVEFIEV